MVPGSRGVEQLARRRERERFYSSLRKENRSAMPGISPVKSKVEARLHVARPRPSDLIGVGAAAATGGKP